MINATKNWPTYGSDKEALQSPDLESQSEFCFNFEDASVRRKFIQKVYLIVICQLVVSIAIVSVALYNNRLQHLINTYPGVIWLFLALLITLMLVMFCIVEVRRRSPMNYICLTTFTLAESLLLAVAANRLDAKEIIWALGITIILFFILTLYAMETRYDFTICGGVLLTTIFILVCFGVIALFARNNLLTLICSAIGAWLFSVYIIYDIQLMLGGDHHYVLNPDEYIFAALTLYLDVVNVFVNILSLLLFWR